MGSGSGIPQELLDKIGPILAKLEQRVRDENDVAERSSAPETDAAALTNALNMSEKYHGIVYSLPKAGTLDEYHDALRKTAANIMQLVFPDNASNDPLAGPTILAISTSFMAQLAVDDPELYQFILIVSEGQWDGEIEHLSRIVATVSYILLFLNYRSGGQRLWLKGESSE